MFPVIDLSTLRLCSLLESAAFAVVFAILWSGRPSAKHLLHWAASSFVYAATICGFQILNPDTPVAGAALFALLGLSDVLLVSGVRGLEGQKPFRRWMLAAVAAPAIVHALPRALGIEVSGDATDSVGVAIPMAAAGCALLFERGRLSPSRGRRTVGLALLGYLPGYAIAASLSLGFHPGQNYLALIPMLSDQLLLGILNLGLLSIPAERDRSRLEEAALRDPLTGAWNRTALVAQMPSLTQAGAVVVAIDIDHFKAINDRYGHATGDDVLLALTRRSFVLLEQQGGKLFRTGGDEFIAVLPQNTLSEARAFAIRLRQWPNETGQLPPWTISVGLSQIEPRDCDFKTALKRADRSLYDAKELGRDRIAA